MGCTGRLVMPGELHDREDPTGDEQHDARDCADQETGMPSHRPPGGSCRRGSRGRSYVDLGLGVREWNRNSRRETWAQLPAQVLGKLPQLLNR